MPVDQTPEQAEASTLSASPRLGNARAKCSVDFLCGTTVQARPAAEGFTVHDAAGKVLATVDDILIALPMRRALDAAEQVRRTSDGAVLATKSRTHGGESFYQSIWNMKQEPRWEP